MSEEFSHQPPDSIPFRHVGTSAETNFLMPAPPDRSLWHKVFIGPSGLRPGWGLLLYIVLVMSLAAGIAAGVRKFRPHPKADTPHQKVAATAEQKPQMFFIGEGISVFVVTFATWVMGRVERRPTGVYGFGSSRKATHFLAGFAWGAIFLAGLVGALWRAGLLVFEGRLLFGGSAVRYGILWAFGFFLVGVFEEYLLRGYLQFTLARGLTSLYRMLSNTAHGEALGFWTAALLLSSFFGFIHGSNPGESPIGLLSAALIGVVFCLTLWRTGSLWWALGFHASWDWGQSYLFGVADSGTMVQGHLFATHPVGKLILSGGATGPEGSLLILPLLVLIVLVIVCTLPARQIAV